MAMQPNRYRIGKDCNYEKSFETYILNNFDVNTYQTVLPFIKELTQLRNVISHLEISKNKDDLSRQITLLVTYLAFVDNINLLIPFGKLKSQMTLTFSWTEVTTAKATTSNSLHYEICSAKYNLAVAFCLRADLWKKSKVDTEQKEALKDYQKAAGVFQEIKEQYLKELVKEGIPDFSESYLEMNINYCLGMGNKCILNICEIKGLDDKIKAKIAMAVYHYFNKASIATLSMPFDKTYYTHLSDLYHGLAYYFFYLSKIKEVTSKGKGMGLMISFLEGSHFFLSKSLSDQSLIKLIIDSDLVANTLSQLELILAENKKKNKFYKETIIPFQSLPEIEKDLTKVKILPHEEQPTFNECLYLINHLVPPEYQSAKNSFMKSLESYLREQCSQFYNHLTIENFLAERSLPQLINGGGFSNKAFITDEQWADIQEIQSKGGYDLLLNEMKGIEVESNSLRGQVQQLEKKLFTDEQENSKYRLFFGNDWTIDSNDTYNKDISTLTDVLSILDFEKNNLNNGIMSMSYIYSLLSLPRHQIESQIPSETTENLPQTVTSSPEADKLRDALDELSKAQERLLLNDQKIFHLFQAPLLLCELQKIKGNYSAEKALLEEKKKLFEVVFMEVEAENKTLQTCFANVDDAYIKFKAKLEQMCPKSNIQSSSPSNLLTNLKHHFNETLNSINKLKASYASQGMKTNHLKDDIEGYLFAKNFTKDELIKILDSKARHNLAK